MPKAPPGWGWASGVMDSGSSIDTFQNPSMLSAPRRSARSVQVANGDTVRVQLEGLAKIFTYDMHGRPTTVGIPDAVSDTRLKTLLSLGRTRRRGIDVNLDDDVPYIRLHSGRQIPLRRDGDICYLDFLVPSGSSSVHPHRSYRPCCNPVLRALRCSSAAPASARYLCRHRVGSPIPRTGSVRSTPCH